MNYVRIAFGVVLLALCLGTTVSAQVPPPPPPPSGGGDGGGAGGGGGGGGAADKITIGMVDTTVKGSATLKGSFTVAAAGVTLSNVKVYALPTTGGAVVVGSAGTIDQTAKTWGGAVAANLLANNYVFRVEGTFSDGTNYSVFSANMVNGSVGSVTWPHLNWNTADSSPTSPAAGKIGATGTWTSNGLAAPNIPVTFAPGVQGYFWPYLMGGGVTTTQAGGAITIVAGGTWTSTNFTGLTSGSTYYVFSAVNGDDMKPYCAPVVTKTVQ